MAADSALIRATEEPHRVEQNLNNSMSAAYLNYKNNLEALEHYCRTFCPIRFGHIAVPTIVAKSTPMRRLAMWSAPEQRWPRM